MVVLGIDVGIQVCGYCVCKVENLDISLIEEGEIKPSRKEVLPQKLNHIFEETEKILKKYNPCTIVVERLYSHHRHPTTLGVLAQVRGVILLLSHQWKIGCFEYSPTRARKSFLGKGNANSDQVKKMAENILGREVKSLHTADAYSLIVAFSHEQKVERLKGLEI
jgi:crossover junction endodeoxyribonuclease RuvC